ncbi:MAG: YbaN family protein [Lachnospiraceae bacterium]|nr:YbaN family protein [Lachnospiraceae bacterium]
MKLKQLILVIVGCICLALGTIGIFLPILPTTPLYLLTALCFARSSRRLDEWFKGTSLYKKHLESFVKKEGMLISTKVGILSTVTLLMGVGLFFMIRKEIWIPCIILAIVWISHMIIFCFL